MRYVPLILSCLILAAHHARGGEPGLVYMWLTLPAALFLRRRWADLVVQVMLVVGAVEWIQTIRAIVDVRQQAGLPYERMIMILGGVALFTALSGLLLNTRGRRNRLPDTDPVGPGFGAFLIAVVLLVPIQLTMEPAGILLERFLPLGGWWEGLFLALYAGWLGDRLQDQSQIRKLRPRVWLLFSIVFFTQLILGLAGIEKLLMNGKLHLPIPALIIAGPIFRGGGLVRDMFFTISVLAAGPAWCSWLCYIGSWDDRAARALKRPQQLPAWRSRMRVGILVLVIAVAFALGRLGVPSTSAGMLAIGFGLFGVGLMVVWSRRTGQMTHCTSFCPMGWVATRLGKVSPWRMKIASSCTDCGACTPACRFDALSHEDVLRRVPGEACTLCGDCLTNCPTESIEYRFPGVSPTRARQAFLVLVAAMHAVWLGVGRL